MAIEDEIVNISDLDIGSEILKTDKLIVETNNGTKLLDFKDFVIGIDNISFYHLISGRGTNVGERKFETIGGHQLLHIDTDLDHKPTYEDLQGGIELTKKNWDAYTAISSLSSQIGQNEGDIQNILARLSEVIAILETPQNLSFRVGAKLRLKKMVAWSSPTNPAAAGKHVFSHWYAGCPSDLEVMQGDEDGDGVADGTDADLIVAPGRTLGAGASDISSVNFKVSIIGADKDLVSDSNLKFNNRAMSPTDGTLNISPFKMTYPAATTFASSTISFNAYIEIISKTPANHIPINVTISGRPVRRSYPQNPTGNTYVYDFGFVETVTREDIVLIKYGTGARSGYAVPKIAVGSSFSGVRMF